MKSPHSTPRAKPQRKARLMFTVTGKNGIELCPSRKDAEFNQQLNEDMDNGPYMVEPVFVVDASGESQEAMVQAGARAMDGLAFYTYKQGDCLPRGHEMSTVEKVNEIQGFRQRTALSKARAMLRELGLLSAPSSPKRGRGK